MDNSKTEPQYKPFVAYKLESGKWGFFMDDDCEKFWSPYPTELAAQEEADNFKLDLEKPSQFLSAWIAALEWLANAAQIPVYTLTTGDIEAATKYQELRPNIETFKGIDTGDSGVEAMCCQVMSYYNSTVAMGLVEHRPELATPWATAALVDRKGKAVISELTKQYCGW